MLLQSCSRYNCVFHWMPRLTVPHRLQLYNGIASLNHHSNPTLPPSLPAQTIANQTFVGMTALLAAFPPCLGATETSKEHQPTHPLLSGSVCRVRDSLDFLSVSSFVSSMFACWLQEVLFVSHTSTNAVAIFTARRTSIVSSTF